MALGQTPLSGGILENDLDFLSTSSKVSDLRQTVKPHVCGRAFSRIARTNCLSTKVKGVLLKHLTSTFPQKFFPRLVPWDIPHVFRDSHGQSPIGFTSVKLNLVLWLLRRKTRNFCGRSLSLPCCRL